MSVAEKITQRLKEKGKRFFACDNISEEIFALEKVQLIDELALKFDEVLRSLVIDIDNDPNSKETGRRLAKMYINELMSGRFEEEPAVTAFPNEGDDSYLGMLVIRAEIHSICSHHWQPVWGTAYIGIIPNGSVLGLSKYIRLAQFAAKRGTLQEELTTHIANLISKHTKTENVAVYIEAEHGCCTFRGVNATNSTTQTCVLRGEFNQPDVKKEFYDNIRLQKS